MCAIYTFLYMCVLSSWSVCLLVLGVADSWIFLSPPPPFLLRWHLHFNFTFWWMDLHCELCRIAQNFHYFLNGRIPGGALKFVCPGCVCVCVWRPSIIIIGLRFNLFVIPSPRTLICSNFPSTFAMPELRDLWWSGLSAWPSGYWVQMLVYLEWYMSDGS